ncbi:MAG: excinuclease subunit, partial [Bacteroidota bacterium]|nr:excinuclease subunit [Bacteroidota bacterium]
MPIKGDKNQKPNTKINTAVDKIVVKGARTHNLKNISLEMPRNTMVAITGMSGSGKSSLAFDTIFAEGQRRYVESLSAYARQFLNQMPKPDVDEITGLSPAISIDQKSRSNNPRSTVATITEIYDYLRVMFARVGRPHCPVCGEQIKKLSSEEILNFVLDKIKAHNKSVKGKKSVMGVDFNQTEVSIFAPVVRGRKGEYYQMLYDFLGKGFGYVRLDGVMHNLREQLVLSKTKKHNIDLLIDAFGVHEFNDDPASSRTRLSEAIERALLEADGLVTISFGSGKNLDKKIAKKDIIKDANDEFTMSAKFACKNDGFSFPEIEPRLFSFNSPYGACPDCNGLGTKYFGALDVCETCNGARLRPEALNVFIKSDFLKSITGSNKETKN